MASFTTTMTKFGGNFSLVNTSLKMSVADVKSLLLLSPNNDDSSYSISFHCAKFWAQRGSRILFISKTPLRNFPPAIGEADVFLNPDALKLIQFMYLPNWQELLKQLYSIHLRRHPVSVIIVKNLEDYFRHDDQTQCLEDHVSLVCASLLYAISSCAKIVSHPVFLISEYVCADCSIERVVVKNFFHNIWQIERSKDENERTFKLSKLSVSRSDEIVSYRFVENLAESRLRFDEVVKSIINLF